MLENLIREVRERMELLQMFFNNPVIQIAIKILIILVSFMILILIQKYICSSSFVKGMMKENIFNMVREIMFLVMIGITLIVTLFAIYYSPLVQN